MPDLQATTTAAPADTPKYRRLTDVDRALILRLYDKGRTQVQIAQHLGCAQSTVSDVLDAFKDTTGEAKRYLRGQSLRMARSIVSKGRASDHVAALKGLNVLEEQQLQNFTLSINGVVLHGIAPARSEAKVADVPVLEGEISEKANE